MKTNRRAFLASTALSAGGLIAGSLLRGAPSATSGKLKGARFNMGTFRAPKLERVRVGVVGLGNRGIGQTGTGALSRLAAIEGVEIRALCDLRAERIAAGLKILGKAERRPETFTVWQRMCERDDLDVIYNCTPWHLHAPISLYAMEHGKHAFSEIPAATTLEECWQLVETSERTRKHCMMLENCCYDFFELMTLNMAQQGVFGEIVHGEGAYIHDLMVNNFSKSTYHDMWRLRQNASRNGNLYPMHGLGPVAQTMDINRGDRFAYLVSMQSNDFQMARRAAELATTDPFYAPFAGKAFRGNMNTTLVRTERGRTIVAQHDVTSPRPYSRLHTISGTKGCAQKYPLPSRIALGHEWLEAGEMAALEEKYTFGFVKEIGEHARRVGGHGGMDFLMDWRWVNQLRHGLPLDMNVYDAATWTSVGLLSELSVANRSQAIDIPDFTAGAWKTAPRLDLHAPVTRASAASRS